MNNEKGYCLFVSWTEVTRKAGHDVHFFNAVPYPVADKDQANALYGRIKRELSDEDHGGWAPRYAFDIEVTATGPNLKVPNPSPDVAMAGIASVRAALARCRARSSMRSTVLQLWLLLKAERWCGSDRFPPAGRSRAKVHNSMRTITSPV